MLFSTEKALSARPHRSRSRNTELNRPNYPRPLGRGGMRLSPRQNGKSTRGPGACRKRALRRLSFLFPPLANVSREIAIRPQDEGRTGVSEPLSAGDVTKLRSLSLQNWTSYRNSARGPPRSPNTPSLVGRSTSETIAWIAREEDRTRALECRPRTRTPNARREPQPRKPASRFGCEDRPARREARSRCSHLRERKETHLQSARRTTSEPLDSAREREGGRLPASEAENFEAGHRKPRQRKHLSRRRRERAEILRDSTEAERRTALWSQCPSFAARR